MRKLSLSLVLSGLLFAQSGYEIAKMVDERIQPKDISSTTTMVLTNSKGKSRTNVMKTKSLDGNKKQIIWFLEPKDDRGVAFLKIEHEGKDDEMRMWLPAFKKVRRISSKKKGDSFMGSDLSYEDMSNRDLNENSYKRLEDEIIDGKDCYVLEITPKPEAKSSYLKHISWIVKDKLIGLKEETFDKRGKLIKRKSFIYKKMKDYFVMNEVFVENVQKKHTTKVSFSDLRVDSGISDNLFQEKNLKRLPR